MKCEKCNQNEATFFYQEQINGHATKVALCQQCAAKAGLLSGQSDPFSILLGGFPSLSYRTARPKSTAPAATCPSCGATLTELMHEGRVGCAACYRTFKAQLAPSIRAMHGNATHTGRTPAKRADVPTQAATNEALCTKEEALRDALKQAIAREDFEKAAALRDEIRALQAKEDT
ncbi:MAG: hypothetical protein E7639_01450 [Ruminococcaceae bacterium]|nr:hypothetical protein [Oscillospiraceae bacterium]